MILTFNGEPVVRISLIAQNTTKIFNHKAKKQDKNMKGKPANAVRKAILTFKCFF